MASIYAAIHAVEADLNAIVVDDDAPRVHEDDGAFADDVDDLDEEAEHAREDAEEDAAEDEEDDDDRVFIASDGDEE